MRKINVIDYEEIERLVCEKKWSLQMIGNKFNVSRMAIYKILNSIGVDTGREKNNSIFVKCEYCNGDIPITRSRLRRNEKNYCSEECYRNWRRSKNII